LQNVGGHLHGAVVGAVQGADEQVALQLQEELVARDLLLQVGRVAGVELDPEVEAVEAGSCGANALKIVIFWQTS
jgi:hypothetical protein